MKLFGQAIDDLTSAISIDPLDAKLYFTRGVIQRQLGNYGKAMGDFTKTLALDPKHTRAYQQRGAILSRLDATGPQASQDLAAAVKLAPQIREAAFLLRTGNF